MLQKLAQDKFLHACDVKHMTMEYLSIWVITNYQKTVQKGIRCDNYPIRLSNNLLYILLILLCYIFSIEVKYIYIHILQSIRVIKAKKFIINWKQEFIPNSFWNYSSI